MSNVDLNYWLDYWAKLVEGPEPESPSYRVRQLARKDWWAGGRARRFNDLARDRHETSAVVEAVYEIAGPDATVVDIGAGTGAYAIPFARRFRQVTALDPSRAMLDFLEQRARQEGLANISVVESKWENADIAAHDVAFCSHAMYASPGLDQFVLKMDRLSCRACFMLARVGNVNEQFRGAWTALRGGERPADPDYLPIYNILYGVGIYANVRMIPAKQSWPFATVGDAVEFVLDYLRMEDTPDNRSRAKKYLSPLLQPSGGMVSLPPTANSVALIWWAKRP